MEQAVRSWKLKDLAAILGGEVVGDGDLTITTPVPAGESHPHGITFAGDAKHLAKALNSEVAAILVTQELDLAGKSGIVVANPRQAFGMVLGLSQRPIPISDGIHPTAVISSEAQVHPSAKIGPFVVIERGVEVKENAVIHAHCYIGENCVVGAKSLLYPRVTLVQDVRIGSSCILHSGCVLGSDGFGFAWTGTHRAKIPQVGGVILGDFVEIGANTTIDRATAGDTVLGNGTKVDNLVQIAHNVKIGEHVAMASHVGISGSVTIGDRVIMGGQAAVSDHKIIGDDVVLGGRSGAFVDVTEPGQYFGLPPIPVTQAMRITALTNRLPELFKRVKALEADKDGS